MAHFIKPFKLTSKITFGDYVDTLQSCPIDKSKIDLVLSVGGDLSLHTDKTLSHANSNDEDTCTKDIVKFIPTPYFEKCNSSEFDKILSIRSANLEMNFEKVRNMKFYLKNPKIAFNIFRCLLNFMT